MWTLVLIDSCCYRNLMLVLTKLPLLQWCTLPQKITHMLIEHMGVTCSYFGKTVLSFNSE